MVKVGYKQTKEHKKNNSKTYFKKGHSVSEELKQTLRKLHTGKKNLNWKGGVCKDRNYVNWLKNRHYYRKFSAEGSHTLGEWELLKKQYGYTCPCCGKKEPEITLTADHIVPLSKGGSDYIENIQPLCQSCNSKKHTQIINYKL
jgi:5-methylcytosine-specific restriction endonuclease McrA